MSEYSLRLRRGCFMRYRLFVSQLLLLAALFIMALPAKADAPIPPAAVATFANEGCSVTVTYTWSGFKGRDLTAEYFVGWALPGGAQAALLAYEYHVSGSGPTSGSPLSQTFDLTGHGTHTYYSRGRLLDKRGALVTGSDAISTASATLTC
jgi:hypothetical protein